MKKALLVIVILFFAVVAVVSGYQAFTIFSENREGVTTYTQLEQYISFPETAEDETKDTSEAAPLQGEEVVEFPEIDFASLQQINSEIIGWIYCEDTTINYPIAQGTDNAYYLKHLFDGKVNSSGCIFLDYRNSGDFSDTHSIIYGHHMKNGKMFGALMSYKKQEFYEEHPRMLLMTPQGNYTMDIFAGYVAKDGESAWQLDFNSREEKEEWIQNSIERSCIQTGITPTAEDKILTLSTCSYEFHSAKFVLSGILTKVE